MENKIKKQQRLIDYIKSINVEETRELENGDVELTGLSNMFNVYLWFYSGLFNGFFRRHLFYKKAWRNLNSNSDGKE